ncbi:hypothetical protein TA3x_001155 [Tundrisphaera sp. TA3]|uniref:hypothetical protein n=1 Tax=Tundrisphaera sp. TA3 TaxID=3435775 RepID=UPI003EBF16AB
MNKLTFALALTLASVAAPNLRAAALKPQTLATPELTASQFSELFTAKSDPMASTYQFANYGSSPTGTIYSQVFEGKDGTAAAGLFAYAYQVGVNNVNSEDDQSVPAHVNSLSWRFDATPIKTSFSSDGDGNPVDAYTYLVKDGQIGGLVPPQAGTGTEIQAPTALSWRPDSSKKFGSIVATFANDETNPLPAGADSATLVVISKQPFTAVGAGILSDSPTTGTVPTVYTATGGEVNPVPIPEPATFLAWAGIIGGAAVARRVRRNRAAA